MNWLQLSYQYLIGGAFFFITMLLCLRQGASDLKNPSDRKAVAYLLLGILGYFSVHLAWILLAS